MSGFVWKDEVSAVFLKQKQILSVFAVMNDIITTMFNKKFMEVLFAGYCHLEAFCNKPLPIGFLCKNGSKMRKSVVVPDNSVP